MQLCIDAYTHICITLHLIIHITKENIQQSNVLGDGCLWGRASLHHHLCFLCCHLLQVGVGMCMACVWCSLSSGYH